MKLAFVSDTHELHGEIAVPPCDVLVCCGDFTNLGTAGAVESFAAWCAELLREKPVRHVVVVAGNHELSLDPTRRESAGGARERAIAELESAGAIYLEGSGCAIEGVTFHGSPWSMRFYDWAFQIDTEAQDLELALALPDRVDVLVTHGPPHRVLDRTYDGRHVGSPALAARVESIRPRVHAFGHIHEAYGIAAGHGTTFVNASTCDARYRPIHPPIVIDLV